MRPLHNRVIVEQLAAEKVSAGGIVLQRSDGPDKAKVLAIGPEVKEVSIGDVVLLNWNAASKAGEHFIITEDQIVLVFEEE